MAKLFEVCNHNTRNPADAFEVGRMLNLTEGETEVIVNYSHEEGWIREPDPAFNRINTGDPPSSRRLRIIYLTSKGIDKLSEKDKPSSRVEAVHVGNNITTNVGHAENSPIQIGNKESTQTTNINEAQVKELKRILSEIEDTLRNNANDITPEDRSNIESDAKDLKQELTQSTADKTRILGKIGSLYNKIRNETQLLVLAIQLVNVFKAKG